MALAIFKTPESACDLKALIARERSERARSLARSLTRYCSDPASFRITRASVIGSASSLRRSANSKTIGLSRSERERAAEVPVHAARESDRERQREDNRYRPVYACVSTRGQLFSSSSLCFSAFGTCPTTTGNRHPLFSPASTSFLPPPCPLLSRTRARTHTHVQITLH